MYCMRLSCSQPATDSQDRATKLAPNLQDLQLDQLAGALGLLRLPGMPETKKLHKLLQQGQSLPHFTPSALDPDSVRFKEKAREKQRQQVRQAHACMASWHV